MTMHSISGFETVDVIVPLILGSLLTLGSLRVPGFVLGLGGSLSVHGFLLILGSPVLGGTRSALLAVVNCFAMITLYSSSKVNFKPTPTLGKAGLGAGRSANEKPG